MKIRVLHLFHDFLNLHGEQGNIKAIKYYLNKQGIDVEVVEHKYNDHLFLYDIDIIVVGNGIEENLEKAIASLDKNKLEKFIDRGGFIFASGNAAKIFSRQGLGICDYDIEEDSQRIVFEGLYSSSITDHECICFINSFVRIKENENWLFKLNKTNTPKITYTQDGYHKDNIYVTGLIGPILVRNPWLNEEILKEVIRSKKPGFEFKPIDYSLEENALNEFKRLYYSKR